MQVVENPQWNKLQEHFNPNVKHSQFILAVDSTYFQSFSTANESGITIVKNFKNGINYYPADQWLREVQNYLIIGRREMLDNQINRDDVGNKYTGNRSYRQVLPYCAICSMLPTGEKLYFPYFRTDKVGESKLANKVSIGYGGHIDAPDVVYHPNSDINLRDTIIGNSIREILTEETRIFNEKGEQVDQSEITFGFADYFITQDTDPEILHLGVIMNMILPLGYRLTAGEDELEVMEPMTARQLLASEYTLEAWTRAMLEADVYQQDNPTQAFIKEEVKTAKAILNSEEDLKLALGTEQITDQDERAVFINCASDVMANAMYQMYLGNPDDTVDWSVEPPVLRPYVPVVNAAVNREALLEMIKTQDKSIDIYTSERRFMSITDDKNRTIFLTEDEEKTLEVATKQKFMDLKGEKTATAPVDADTATEQSLDESLDVAANLASDLVAQVQVNSKLLEEHVSLLLDGQEMTNASFNEMVVGDPGKTPTPEEIDAYLKMNPQDEVKG